MGRGAGRGKEGGRERGKEEWGGGKSIWLKSYRFKPFWLFAQGVRERDKREGEGERGGWGAREQEWEGERGKGGTNNKNKSVNMHQKPQQPHGCVIRKMDQKPLAEIMVVRQEKTGARGGSVLSTICLGFQTPCRLAVDYA